MSNEVPSPMPNRPQATKCELVSTDSEQLILVDAGDRAVGVLDKASCHDGQGVLHRAFSAFLFNDRGEVFIQQRAADKRLWPSYWSNSCCSHPRPGETMERAVHRRLGDELGLAPGQVLNLRLLYKFEYRATFGAAGGEHELCWVFQAQFDGDMTVNVTEIADWAWVAPDALTRRLAEQGQDFTPWLKLEWPRVMASRGLY